METSQGISADPLPVRVTYVFAAGEHIRQRQCRPPEVGDRRRFLLLGSNEESRVTVVHVERAAGGVYYAHVVDESHLNPNMKA